MTYTTKQKEVTEITVGSAFYAPALFDQFTHLRLEKAAGFALRVTRQPEKKYRCLSWWRIYRFRCDW
ncbi:hypothetical protein OL548_25405 [Lysinibacillus sp. MHQ-1]|nr:hypothetical protein OL548_25405 [Lysinibacillus sp. MHQ-1]